MKFNSYEEYLEHAKKHFASKKELTIPIENMLLDKEMFDLFNGSIKFGVGNNKCCKDGECNCKNALNEDTHE